MILLSNFAVCFCYKGCTPIKGKVICRCFWWAVGVKIKFLVKYAHEQTLNLGTLVISCPILQQAYVLEFFLRHKEI